MYGKITPSSARVVKSVDTADLKSAAHKTGMPVRFRPRAPTLKETPFIGAIDFKTPLWGFWYPTVQEDPFKG